MNTNGQPRENFTSDSKITLYILIIQQDTEYLLSLLLRHSITSNEPKQKEGTLNFQYSHESVFSKKKISKVCAKKSEAPFGVFCFLCVYIVPA
jgi:hypothetical protein